MAMLMERPWTDSVYVPPGSSPCYAGRNSGMSRLQGVTGCGREL
jgi:hypothetical protein